MMSFSWDPGPGTKPTLNHRRFMFFPKKLGLLLILIIQPSSMEMSTPFTIIFDIFSRPSATKWNEFWCSNERAFSTSGVFRRPLETPPRSSIESLSALSHHWRQITPMLILLWCICYATICNASTKVCHASKLCFTLGRGK